MPEGRSRRASILTAAGVRIAAALAGRYPIRHLWYDGVSLTQELAALRIIIALKCKLSAKCRAIEKCQASIAGIAGNACK